MKLPNTVDYLRISLTDRCNERCFYCLPKGFCDWKPRREILSYEEIFKVVSVALSLGFRKFRITGGEPLIRQGVEQFIAQLIATPGVVEVGLSTNGTRLAKVAAPLAQAGLRHVNVSLDALDPAIYRRITGGRVEEVLAGLEAARQVGMKPIKLNTVLMRGINEGQIWRLIDYAAEYGHLLRFVELMPVSTAGLDAEECFLSVQAVRRRIEERTEIKPDLSRYGNGPAEYYYLPRYGVTIGFIGAMTTEHFCEECNKMRLTADGKIRPCLGQSLEFDLKPALREMRSLEAARDVLSQAIMAKPSEHIFRKHYQPDRIMTAIGG